MGISEENNNIAGMQEDDAAVVYEAESCLELENAEWDTHATHCSAVKNQSILNHYMPILQALSSGKKIRNFGNGGY